MLSEIEIDKRTLRSLIGDRAVFFKLDCQAREAEINARKN